MAVSEIIISIANVLETALLVAIIIEFVKIFTSKKKEGESSASESVLAASKKLFGNSEEKIAKKEAEKEKKAEELKKKEAELEEIGRASASLAIDSRNELGILVEGHQKLEQIRNDPNFLQLSKDIETKVLEHMITAADNLETDRNKLSVISRKSIGKAINDMKNEINTITKDVQDEIAALNEELLQAKRNKDSLDNNPAASIPEKEEATRLISIKQNELDNLVPILGQITQTSKNLIGEMNKDLIEDNKRMLVLEKQAESSLKNIRNDLSAIKDALSKLNDKDPKKRGTYLGTYDSKLTSLKQDITIVKQNVEGMIVGQDKSLKEFRNRYSPHTRQLIELTKRSVAERKKLEEYQQ